MATDEVCSKSGPTARSSFRPLFRRDHPLDGGPKLALIGAVAVCGLGAVAAGIGIDLSS
jgi:hypothetical protein